MKQISGLLFYRYVCHLWYSTTTAVNNYVWLMMALHLGRAQLMNQYQETCTVLLLGQNNIIMCSVLGLTDFSLAVLFFIVFLLGWNNSLTSYMCCLTDFYIGCACPDYIHAASLMSRLASCLKCCLGMVY